MQAQTTLAPQDAFNAMHHYMAANGIHITSATPPTLSGVVVENRRPSVIVAIILLLLCIVPGVIYLIAAGKDRTHTVAVMVQPSPTGGSLVAVDGNGWAYAAAAKAAKSLP